jgi:hypothetical protein
VGRDAANVIGVVRVRSYSQDALEHTDGKRIEK